MNEPPFHIRPATPEDAEAACAVLRRSITELCRADHLDAKALLDAWLANKTARTVAGWIADPRRRVLVAVAADGTILGVGMASVAGAIELNYVSPDARFRGISRAVLRDLEDWLRDAGHRSVRLVSTETARRFYLALGYCPDGPAKPDFGVATSQPMVKAL